MQTLFITALSVLLFSFISSFAGTRFSYILSVCIAHVQKEVFKGWSDFGCFLFFFFFFFFLIYMIPFLFSGFYQYQKKNIELPEENQLELAKHLTFPLWIFMWIENRICLVCDCVSFVFSCCFSVSYWQKKVWKVYILMFLAKYFLREK